jgi:hypothetical protein
MSILTHSLTSSVCARWTPSSAARVERRLQEAKDLAFYTGPFLLDGREPYLPGSRLVYLTQSEREQDYYDLDRAEPLAAHRGRELFGS